MIEEINIKHLKYDPSKVKNKLKQIGDKVICTEDLVIVFPETFVSKELAYLGSTVRLVCLAAVVDSSNNYCVLEAPVYADFLPDRMSDVKHEGESYKVLHFNKDDVVIGSMNLIMQNKFFYELLNLIYFQGKVPFYLDYERLSSIFLESSKFAGSSIGKDSVMFELITAVMARDAKNKTKYWRHVLNQGGSHGSMYPVGLSDVFYAYDNTGAKIIGSFFEQGVVNAINNPEEKPTETVNVLRY